MRRFLSVLKGAERAPVEFGFFKPRLLVKY